MAGRGDLTRNSCTPIHTRAMWERLVLVTRLPFLLRGNSAFKVDGSEFAGSPWAIDASSFNFVFPKHESGKNLNHLLLLHTHKQLTNSIDLIAVANEFLALSEHRLSLFGKFSDADILPIGFCGKCKALLKCTSCNCWLMNTLFKCTGYIGWFWLIVLQLHFCTCTYMSGGHATSLVLLFVYPPSYECE